MKSVLDGGRETSRRTVACCVAALALAASGGVHAVRLQSGGDVKMELVNGVRTDTATAAPKVSSPDLPSNLQASASQSVGSGGSGSNAFSPTFDPIQVVADPGDGAGATLCVAYVMREAVEATVTAPTGSAASGVGGSVGFLLDSTVAPASATVPNPATLIVTPLVGPIRTVVSAPPLVVATTGATQSDKFSKRGSFLVSAGDVITLDVTLGEANRGELPAGASKASASVQVILNAGCTAPSIPALSAPGQWALSVLILLLAIGALSQGRRRRGARN